jgi:hypothetical protein
VTHPPQTKIKVYETIQKIGNGSVYTACDGIPRYRFHESPTVHLTSTVTVTSVIPEVVRKWAYEPDCMYSDNLEFCQSLTWPPDSNATDEFDARPLPPWIRGPLETTNELKCGEDTILCRIDMGEEVVLIFWPPVAPSRGACGSSIVESVSNVPRTIVTSAITFNGQNLYLRKSKIGQEGFKIVQTHFIPSSVLPGPFTFIEPTIYLAHHPISLFNMGGFGGEPDALLSPPGILTLKSSDIYSIRPKGSEFRHSANYAQLVAHGQYLNPQVDPIDDEHVPFDFEDIRNPVPASLYYDARSDDCWGKQTHCGTITDDSYQPRIAIKNRVWYSIETALSACSRARLVDPPIVLTLIPTMTLPLLPKFTHAQPEESLAQAAMSPTAVPKPGNTIGPYATGRSKPTSKVPTGHNPHAWLGNLGLGILPKLNLDGDLEGHGEQPKITPGPSRTEKGGQATDKSKYFLAGRIGDSDPNAKVTDEAKHLSPTLHKVQSSAADQFNIPHFLRALSGLVMIALYL